MDFQNLALRPNCLMTKSPLVFIPGPKKFLFYKKSFGDLPRFLHEHGYEVLLLDLPLWFRSRRQKVFLDWVKNQKSKKFHFIADTFASKEFLSFLPKTNIASFTSISETLHEDHYQRFLDRCIELAENEWVEEN